MAVGSPIPSLLLFLAITTIYIALRMFSTDAYKSRHVAFLSKIASLGYVFCVIIVQFFINLAHTKTVCGSKQTGKALFYTLVPNIFMFGLIFGILIILPGWKAPFANTIGYAIIKTMGVADLLRKMIKTTADLKKADKPSSNQPSSNQPSSNQPSSNQPSSNQPSSNQSKPIATSPTPMTYAGGYRRKKRRGTRKRLLQHGGETKREQAIETRVEIKEILKYVENDPSLLVNEITPQNWDTWINKTALPKLFKSEYTKDKNHPDIEKLYNLVSLRDLVGEYIWLILAGFLVITTQTNALYSINCKGESSEVERQLQEKWAKAQAKMEGSKKKKFFTRE